MKRLLLILMSCFPLLLSAGCSKDNDSINDQIETEDKEKEMINPSQIKIQVGEAILPVNLEDNTSAKALVELLREGPVSIDMNDYANMEKVGSLPVSLPQNNRSMHTVPGDVILYLGKYFVIYYGNNDYSLTKLGVIDGNYSGAELKNILGNGDVTVIISL